MEVWEDIAYPINNAPTDTDCASVLQWYIARSMKVGRNWYDQKVGNGMYDAHAAIVKEMGIHFTGAKFQYICEVISIGFLKEI